MEKCGPVPEIKDGVITGGGGPVAHDCPPWMRRKDLGKEFEEDLKLCQKYFGYKKLYDAEKDKRKQDRDYKK